VTLRTHPNLVPGCVTRRALFYRIWWVDSEMQNTQIYIITANGMRTRDNRYNSSNSGRQLHVTPELFCTRRLWFCEEAVVTASDSISLVSYSSGPTDRKLNENLRPYTLSSHQFTTKLNALQAAVKQLNVQKGNKSLDDKWKGRKSCRETESCCYVIRSLALEAAVRSCTV